MNGPYDDIIHLPHHVSASRPRMTVADRAAQFSPFAALTGHNAVIKETARLTDKQIELDEDSKSDLSIKLNLLENTTVNHPKIAITFFKADERKAGGSYVTATGYLKKIDEYEHVIIMLDGTIIPIGDILEIESELFKAFL